MTAVLVLALPVLLLAAGAVFSVLYARAVERRYPPTGRFMEIGGLRLHYLDTGPPDGGGGGTVVLLHGASSNLAEAMLGIGSHLAGRYRVVAFDRPGYGWTIRKGRPDLAQPARQAGLLAEALRRLGVHGAVVVGHSWSGTLAPLLALDHRDVTGAILVLSGVTQPWPGGEAGWFRRIVASALGEFLARTLAVPLGLLLSRATAGMIFRPQERPPGFLEKARVKLVYRPRVLKANAEDIAALHGAVARQSPRYREIRMPVTVIGGDADAIVWTDLHSRAFAQAVPGARLVILPGIGHMPQYARPAEVIAEIEALAAQVAAPSGVQGA